MVNYRSFAIPTALCVVKLEGKKRVARFFNVRAGKFLKWNLTGHVEKWYCQKADKILYLMYSTVHLRNDLY